MSTKYPLAGELQAKAAQHLVSNPGYTKNPAWVTDLIASYWDILEDKVPPAWLPRLDNVRPGGKKQKHVVADVSELGCGAYGCVLPTLDPKVVLKVTSDETEAHFAVHWADRLVAPVCVRYYMVIALSDRHQGRPLHLLWRQAAEHVGEIGQVVGKNADLIIDGAQERAAYAFDAIYKGMPAKIVSNRLAEWTTFIESVAARRVPEVDALFRGMLRVLREQHVLFGDVHAGNVGRVDGRWVIVDPGNVAEVAGIEVSATVGG